MKLSANRCEHLEQSGPLFLAGSAWHWLIQTVDVWDVDVVRSAFHHRRSHMGSLSVAYFTYENYFQMHSNSIDLCQLLVGEFATVECFIHQGLVTSPQWLGGEVWFQVQRTIDAVQIGSHSEYEV